MKKKKENFLQKHYSLSWEYIKESRGCIIFIIIIFLTGFIIALNYQPPEIVELIKKFVEGLLEEVSGLNLWQLIVYILNNNLKSSFFAMVFGIFFGIFPVFTTLLNGYVLGFVAEKSVQVEGVSILWRLFPHGIFEFPAVILALALGIKLGMFVFSAKEKSRAFLAFIVSLSCFIFFSGIVISFALKMSSIFLDVEYIYFSSTNLTNNPLLELFLLASLLVILIFSTLVGMTILSTEDHKIVSKEFLKRLENSLRVFLFVVLPLLIIAAIIEGVLIFVVG